MRHHDNACASSHTWLTQAPPPRTLRAEAHAANLSTHGSSARCAAHDVEKVGREVCIGKENGRQHSDHQRLRSVVVRMVAPEKSTETMLARGQMMGSPPAASRPLDRLLTAARAVATSQGGWARYAHCSNIGSSDERGQRRARAGRASRPPPSSLRSRLGCAPAGFWRRPVQSLCSRCAPLAPCVRVPRAVQMPREGRRGVRLALYY